VELRPLEYRLLVCLTRNAEKVLTHQELLEQVWGPNYDSAGVVKLYVSYLRRKIELDPETPELILSMWGVGYRYQPPGKSTQRT
jgi:two-component system KDP operon response regulator KdpE